MRRHRAFRMLAPRYDAVVLREIVRPDRLVWARFEPILRGTRPDGALDLVFESEGRIVLVPALSVQASMLLLPESSPLIWPDAIAVALDEETAASVEALVLPWLYAHAVAGRMNAEITRWFSDYTPARNLVERARVFGWLAAAPYERVLAAAAPYLYAVRLARGRRVVAWGEATAATGIALLAQHAQVHATLDDPAVDAEAARWFATDAFDGAVVDDAEIAVGPGEPRKPAAIVVRTDGDGPGRRIDVATPVPLAIPCSFDPDDAPTISSFRVLVDEEPSLRVPLLLPDHRAVGGSSGRIAFVMREDWRRAPDADVDAALALADRLRAEGLEVEMLAPSRVRPEEYGLLHVHTVEPSEELEACLRAAKERGLPIVTTPHLDDAEHEGLWGAEVVDAVFANAVDEDRRDEYLQFLAARRLEHEGHLPGREPYPGYLQRMRALLDAADVMVVESAAEARLLAERYGRTERVVICAPLLPSSEIEPIGALVGAGEFVLIHAPIARRSNQLLAVHATISSGIPLVLAGEVTEPGYHGMLLEWWEPRVAFIPHPSPREIEALYRRARVVVDIGWRSYGLARVARAAIAGATVVTHRNAHAATAWGRGAVTVDRADVASLASGIERAWSGAGEEDRRLWAGRVAAALNPPLAVTTVARAYALAASVAGGAVGSPK
jgi:hypothetical protein